MADSRDATGRRGRRTTAGALIGIGALAVVSGLAIALSPVPGPVDGAARVPASPTGSAAPPTAPPDASAPSSPTPAPTTSPTPEVAVPASEPESIRIGSAGVDHALTSGGLSADGTINPDPGEVMWFTESGRVAPGRPGTAVIAGHVVWNGAPDAFARLGDVRVGDTVEVGYADGSAIRFTVTETHVVDKDELSRSPLVWGENSTVRRLAIITCDPALGYEADGHLSANLLVVAET